ncbi:kinesin-like protein KIF13B isoform X2 [Nematostella vectensis]|uniref:kinesin-like protein KIF13B isoform X2 n=1 Tax=Nematostella vectensis TaxID=45351 RepID=UPI002076DEBE|nr:kinesin-like protein KIF13B isoform X2 [Nematostella vectensis]
MGSKVKVAVRVRPLNRREIDLGSKVVVDMEENQTILLPSRGNDRKQAKNFAFDHCFWSIDAAKTKFAAQDKVYECLGSDVLENAFEGYNACIFAYGQTGSGKTYTMMGAGEDKGIIPRLCVNLFRGISQNDNHDITYKVEVSYIEIYNEKVRDLLCPRGGSASLRVREHKVMGPYVEGLTKLVVSSFEDIEAIMMEGNKSRTVAATRMNTESSRSHAVFNILLARTEYDHQTESIGEKVSKLSLVDLAGSERACKTGAEGDRLKEGSNINRSLVTLGQVISSLAEQSAGKHGKKGAHFVPYRDSVLTWLLKDNLGGNSKTVMVATISPSADNYEETLSTLRYADRAKKIVNHAVVNEDPNARIIRELREEVERLKHLLQSKIAGFPIQEETGELEIQEMISENENLMKECTMSWEQKEKQTEKIQQERHKALEDMGISIQSSGIGVEKNKFYLVNLNADPAMNELLVYYLKEHSKVGRLDANHTPDIQLGGLGILPEHCEMDIEENEVYLTPSPNARTFVNGRDVKERTLLRHGDRILWGNNHFFRINCPRPPGSSEQQPEQQVDFMSAQQELMMHEIAQGPLQESVRALEEQYQADKQGALEKQRLMYEEKIEELKKEVQMSPFGSRPQIDRTSSLSSFSSGYGSRMSWYEDRELSQSQYDPRPEQRPLVLKEEVLKANTLVREANQLSEEMNKDTDFAVTLQIPTSSLTFGKSRSGYSSEVAIVVKHKSRGTQIWSLDKLSNKIYDMRELYNQCIEEGVPFNDKVDDTDLFFEVECHTLIGVCNVFLECLLHDVSHEYAAPIISQQGEVCGRLKVEVSRVTGDDQSDNESVGSDADGRISPEDPDDLLPEDDEGPDLLEELPPGSIMTVGVRVIEAFDLPPALCNYVFCQYQLWKDENTVVVPPINASISHPGPKTNTMIFENKQMFDIEVTEEFLEYASEGSLAIEVWGNRCQAFDNHNKANWSVNIDTPQKGLQDRWSELVRKMEMLVEIHEINDQGVYAPVELQTRVASESGGTFQLRQGHSRRLVVRVSPLARSGALPVVCNIITSVSVGSICVRNKNQSALDSYQEKDLALMREKWSNSLMKRREYLDDQIHSSMNNPDKSVVDKERESWLIDQWVCLTEERNAVLCPLPGSGIPGAPPTDENIRPNVESHIPVIFLDLNDDFRNGLNEDAGAAGVDTTLSFENPDNMVELPIIKYDQKQVSATTSWDSSIHDSIYMNRITSANERIYLIVKAVVRLSSPVAMELVLRKRICVRIYKKQSWKDSILRKISRDAFYSCGVYYELVSHIPRQPGEETEERASLAQMAAQAMGEEEEDETVLRRYSKGISNVESLLAIDKLRQEVVVKEKLAAIGKPLRKFASTPNLAAVGIGRSEYHIANSQSFSESRSNRSSGRDDLLIDFSSFVSPPSTSSPVQLRDTSVKRNSSNSRPSSLLLELETLDEDVRSLTPSPKAQTQTNLFDFNDSRSAVSEGTISPSPDELRDRTASSDTITYDEPPATPYDDLPTPTPFGAKPLVAPTQPESKTESNNWGKPLLKAPELLSRKEPSKFNVGKTKKTNLLDLQAAFTEKMDMFTLDSPEPETSGPSLIPGQSTNKKPKTFDDLFSIESIKAELEKSKVEQEGTGTDSSDLTDISGLVPGLKSEDSKHDTTIESPSSDISALLLDTTANGETDTQTFETAIDAEKVLRTDVTSGCTNDSSGRHEQKELDDDLTAAICEKPEITGTPEMSSTPKVTTSPEVSSTPEVSFVPDVLSTQQERSTPEVPLTPEVPSTQQATSTPEVTSTSEETTAPDLSPKQEATPTPETTFISKVTSAPEISYTHEAAPTPETPLTSQSEQLSANQDGSSADRLYAASEGSEGMFGSRDDLSSLGSRDDLEDWDESNLAGLSVGMAIEVGKGKTGVIRFIGATEFSPGPWVGVELDKAGGKNDGSVSGVRYFACKPRFGSFVRPDKVKIITNSARERSTSRRSGSRDIPTRSSSIRGLERTESSSRSSLGKASTKTRTDSPSRGARKSEGGASAPAGRGPSPATGSPVVKRENSGANRKKNEWKRRSNILF